MTLSLADVKKGEISIWLRYAFFKICIYIVYIEKQRNIHIMKSNIFYNLV